MTIVEFLTARLNEEGAAWGGGVQLFTQPSFAKLSRYMIADVAAKRAILELVDDVAGDSAETLDHPGVLFINDDNWERVLRLLATPYAAHPDYQQEWKP